MKTFQNTITALGYCCPTEFFLKNTTLSHKELAETLELSPRTIRLHKQIVQDESECPGYSICLKRHHQHP